MAVPGWPAFAFWTASIARTRMVSIERFWTSSLLTAPSLFVASRSNVTPELRHSVVQLALPRAGLAQRRKALRARLDDTARRGRIRRRTQPLERYHGGPARGGLFDPGERERALQDVGDDLHPILVHDERVA